MRNKPRLLLIVLIVANFISTVTAIALKVFPWEMIALISGFFLAITIVIYQKFYQLESQKIENEVLKNLQLNYTEVIPFHPFLLATRYHIPFEKDFKVFAKVVCYGYKIHVKFVFSKGARTIVTSDYLWFYTNFKEKESN